MKKWIAALFLAIAAPASAAPFTETLDWDGDCYGVDVASHTGTAMFDATTTTRGGATIITSTGAWRYVWVQNVDPTYDLFCRYGLPTAAPTIGVSVATGQPTRGARVEAGNSVFFAVPAGRVFYCKNNSGSAATAATACVGK